MLSQSFIINVYFRADFNAFFILALEVRKLLETIILSKVRGKYDVTLFTNAPQVVFARPSNRMGTPNSASKWWLRVQSKRQLKI